MWAQWGHWLAITVGLLGWCFCAYAIYLFVSTLWKHGRPKHARLWMRLIAKWGRVKDRGAARIDRVWVLGTIVLSLVVIVYASTKQRETKYECPDFCLGVQQVENPFAIRTVNLKSGEIREWRFCPGNGVNLFKGYVIELYAAWTGWCYDLNGTRHYHIVTGRDIENPRYSLVKTVSRADCNPISGRACGSDHRPALVYNCRDTADDSDVVCDGDPKFTQETANAGPR